MTGPVPPVLALLLLAGALLCLPQPPAGARLTLLRPVAARRRRDDARWRSVAPAALATVLGALLAGPGGGLAALLVAEVVRRRRAAHRREAAARAASDELAAAVSRMADELTAGAHPATALDGADADGPVARALLVPAALAGRLGDDVPQALRRAARERPEVRDDVDRVATAWALADRYGIPLAELLDGARSDLRWRSQFAGRVRAELAGPRATAAVLTALPVLGLALGQLVGADPLAVLRGGVIGQLLLVGGVALAAAGTVWSEHILRSAVPR